MKGGDYKMVQVKKRDGSLEDFNRQKVYQSVVAAGLSETEANNIADQVETWVMEKEEVVSTGEVRNKVIGFLEAKNPEAAESYRSYKK